MRQLSNILHIEKPYWRIWGPARGVWGHARMVCRLARGVWGPASGAEGLPKGSEGLPRGSQGGCRWTCGRTSFLPLSAILSPCQPQGLHSRRPFFINLCASSHVRLSSISFLLLASSHLFLRDSFHLAPVASSYRNWLVEVQRRF